MVPPENIFGRIDLWIGVYTALLITLVISGSVFYSRVIRLVRLGQRDDRFDHPWRRFWNFLVVSLGQRKVLQRVSLADKAGISHVFIFVGFLSFLLSYLIFIFGDSVWSDFSERLLTYNGVKAYSIYLDIVAVGILGCLTWAIIRRWWARPHRLNFDLTRSKDAIIIVALIGTLMISTLLTEGFFIAMGGIGPETDVIVGGFIASLFLAVGIDTFTAFFLHNVFWWVHLLVILGFAVYIPFSKHMHMVASPFNTFFHSLHPSGMMKTMDLETETHFGVGKVDEFTWKQLLDGYACAVCGRCTEVCPANITGKILSPMHIVWSSSSQLIDIMGLTISSTLTANVSG